MNEEWKDIAGFPGYQISNYGRIRTKGKVTSNARYARRVWKARIMRQKLRANDGYLQINLWNEEGAKTFLVHRLVADAFLDDPGEAMTVNHKDGNKQNNNISNLEWMTLADNIRHGMDNGLYHAMKPCTLVIGDEIKTFRSQSAASRFLGKTSGYIYNAIKRGNMIYDSKGRKVVVA